MRTASIAALAAMAGACRPGEEHMPIEPDRDRGPAHTNRLAATASPYLLQHADNPVDWYPWGAEAFEKARREQKPIFLSIGYSACHWCHVMEHESFENRDLAALLNRHFVSIKVDREERPDLDAIYMTAVQMMTGRGGWPLSVFLTPELEPFYGGTYFPPEDRFGLPGFGTVLKAVNRTWQTEREAAVRSAGELSEALRRAERLDARDDAVIDNSLAAQAVAELKATFDSELGGFSEAPKFPSGGAIAMLLRQYARDGDERLLEMALLTLDRMAGGGIHDQVGGGFHRYSVDREWLVPHFEKMLYDNAILSMVYLQAYQLTHKPRYRQIATGILDYVLRDMTDPRGGFYSSEDADSEGREGLFYVWSRDEIVETLGHQDAALFNAFYGVTPGGNSEGSNILHIEREPAVFASQHELAPAELEDRLAPMRARLLAARGRRVRPGRDDKILSAWNGLMISSFARAAQVLGNPRYRSAAKKAGRFMLSSLVVDGQLKRAERDGKAAVPGYLDDHAQAINAMADLYETTFDTAWLDAAVGLADDMLRLFGGSPPGFNQSSSGQNLIARRQPFMDGALPSGNAAAVLALLRVDMLTGRTRYSARVETVLEAAVPMIRRRPSAFVHMLEAVDLYLAPREIVIAGHPSNKDTGVLLDVVHNVYVPGRVLALSDPARADPGRPDDNTLLDGKDMLDGRATAYVCENRICGKPLTNAGQLATLLRRSPRDARTGAGIREPNNEPATAAEQDKR